MVRAARFQRHARHLHRGFAMLLLVVVFGCDEGTEPPVPNTAPSTTPPPVAVIGQSLPASTPSPTAVAAPVPLTKEAWKESCNRMRFIVRAILSYHDAKKHYPPSIVLNEAGQPLYSWRVELLPFIGRGDLYEKFDKTKPWDAPENLSISNTPIDVYKSPLDTQSAVNGCSYVTVVGPNCALGSGGSLGDSKSLPNFFKMQDGVANTICLIEVAGRSGSWASPNDLAFDGLLPQRGSGSHQIPSPYDKGINMAMLDASALFFPDEDIKRIFNFALTGNDGLMAEF